MSVPAPAQALRRALPLFLLAGVCLSTLDATAKYLVQDHSLLLVVWARYVGQMVVVTPFALRVAGAGFWRTRRLRVQLARSAFLLAATLFFFAALRFLPLAEGSSVMYLAPMFVVLLSGPMLGERPGPRRYLATVGGFAGVLIMLRPGSGLLHPAVLLLVAAAFSNAIYQMLTRKLLDERPHTTLFYSALVGAIGVTAALPWTAGEGVPSWRDVVFLLILGVSAGLGHWLIIGAYRLAPASLLTPFTYTQVLWATTYGYLVFGQLPDGGSALGMAVVVASGVVLALQERHALR